MCVVALALEIGLMFIWPVPNTVALRNVLLLLLLVSLPFIRPDWTHAARSLYHSPTIVLVALSVWILLHNFFFAWDMVRTWRESLQWFKSVLCLLLGVAVACAPRNIDRSGRWRLWSGGMAIAWAAYLSLTLLFKDWGQPLSRALLSPTPLGTRDIVSYIGTGLLALLLAEWVGRRAGLDRTFRIPQTTLLAGVALTALSTAATTTRNALPIIALDVAVATAALTNRARARGSRWLQHKAIVVLAMMLAVAIGANVVLDERWQNFTSSVRIGWDIDRYHWWIDQEVHPQPATAQGIPVDHSAYNRVAWLRGVCRMILAYPLGTGFDRSAFRQALVKYYGAERTASGHAHIGLLDFTLATGLPGGLMLVATFVLFIRLGWKRWRQSSDLCGLVLVFYTGSYFFRAGMDGVLRDHMLEQSMFVIGLLLASTTERLPEVR